MKTKRKIMVATFMYPPIEGRDETPHSEKEAHPTQPVLTSFEFVEVDLERWTQAVAASPFKAKNFLIPVSYLRPSVSFEDELGKPLAGLNGVEDEI
jgi:hypothetical protein